MSKIGACLWMDGQAEEAATFYTHIFPNSQITGTTHYTEAGQEHHGHRPGSVMTVEYEIDGFRFSALNGGPYFSLNPSISFFVHCETEAEVERIWKELSAEGTVLMPLDTYPFSERYGWIQDRFGVSYQLILATEPIKQRIVPCMLFVGDLCGKAEQAMFHYVSVFDNAALGEVVRYEAGQEPDIPGSVMYGEFRLAGQPLVAMDSAQQHAFSFNEAVSFIIDVADQEEIDHYWNALSAVPEAEMCGWLKDRYGVSWQVLPDSEMNRVLHGSDEERKTRALEALFQMKKIDIAALRGAMA